jgi:hypothetical protein
MVIPMKILRIITLALLATSCLSQKPILFNNDVDVDICYINAFNTLLEHKETKNSFNEIFGRNKFCYGVSSELIPFEEEILDWFPKIITMEETNRNIKDVELSLGKLLGSEPKRSLNENLIHLKSCEKPNIIVFFSEIKEGVLYAKVYGSDDFSKSYEKYPLDYLNLELSYLIYFDNNKEIVRLFMNGIWYGV